MLTGELRNQIDGIWNDFWSGGLSNPLQVIEQITYLIFIKRLDEMQELEERKATTLGKPIERRIFPEGKDDDRARRALCEPALVAVQAFRGPRDVPHRRRARLPLHPRSSTATARPMRATCATPAFKFRGRRCWLRSSTSSTSSTWATAIPRATSTSTCWQDRDRRPERPVPHAAPHHRDDGRAGAPKPEDVICDPACGTCGFLVAAGEYLREHHAALFQDDKLRRHFNEACSTASTSTPRCCASAR